MDQTREPWEAASGGGGHQRARPAAARAASQALAPWRRQRAAPGDSRSQGLKVCTAAHHKSMQESSNLDPVADGVTPNVILELGATRKGPFLLQDVGLHTRQHHLEQRGILTHTESMSLLCKHLLQDLCFTPGLLNLQQSDPQKPFGSFKLPAPASRYPAGPRAPQSLRFLCPPPSPRENIPASNSCPNTPMGEKKPRAQQVEAQHCCNVGYEPAK